MKNTYAVFVREPRAFVLVLLVQVVKYTNDC